MSLLYEVSPDTVLGAAASYPDIQMLLLIIIALLGVAVVCLCIKR